MRLIILILALPILNACSSDGVKTSSLGMKVITLNCDRTTVFQMLLEITTQTGCKYQGECNPLQNPTISLGINKLEVNGLLQIINQVQTNLHAEMRHDTLFVKANS